MADESFLIERVDVPRWLRDDAADGTRQLLGGDTTWGWAIPLMHQILAAPRARRPFPQPPSTGGRGDPYAYWTALLHLLLYSFGWSRPDLGMRWWYDAGKPTNDPRLRLISEVWDADGQLDWFSAWLWTFPMVAELYRHELRSERAVDAAPRINVDGRWLEALLADADRTDFPTPIGGGADPLHLSYHCDIAVGERAPDHTLVVSTPAQRKAALIVESMVGWYRCLSDLELPDIGQRSWRVEVVCRPVGFLGTYRRSRATELWFAGPHSIHVKGN